MRAYDANAAMDDEVIVLAAHTTVAQAANHRANPIPALAIADGSPTGVIDAHQWPAADWAQALDGAFPDATAPDPADTDATAPAPDVDATAPAPEDLPQPIADPAPSSPGDAENAATDVKLGPLHQTWQPDWI